MFVDLFDRDTPSNAEHRAARPDHPAAEQHRAVPHLGGNRLASKSPAGAIEEPYLAASFRQPGTAKRGGARARTLRGRCSTPGSSPMFIDLPGRDTHWNTAHRAARPNHPATEQHRALPHLGGNRLTRAPLNAREFTHVH